MARSGQNHRDSPPRWAPPSLLPSGATGHRAPSAASPNSQRRRSALSSAATAGSSSKDGSTSSSFPFLPSAASQNLAGAPRGGRRRSLSCDGAPAGGRGGGMAGAWTGPPCGDGRRSSCWPPRSGKSSQCSYWISSPPLSIRGEPLRSTAAATATATAR